MARVLQKTIKEIPDLAQDANELSTASGSAPSYAARAWVRFNGSTAAINGSGNVSSITKNSGGLYTVNFTTAMEDVNYSVTCSPNNGSGYQNSAQITSITTTSTQIETTRESNSTTLRYDSSTTCCVIHK
jgi:hypothetical protein